MKDYTGRLQVLERFFCVKSIPTFEQFKTKWAEADPLSRSVIAALAESGEFEALIGASSADIKGKVKFELK